jgi:hypothetical protein
MRSDLTCVGRSLKPELLSASRFCPLSRGDAGEVDRDPRREETQKLFRRGNESLHDAAVGAEDATTPVPFLCECADEDCLGRVELTPSEWEVVTAEPDHYVMIAGHLRSEGEEVVGSAREYEIARKLE